MSAWSTLIEQLDSLNWSDWRKAANEIEYALRVAWERKHELFPHVLQLVAASSPVNRVKTFLFDGTNIHESKDYYIRLHRFRQNPLLKGVPELKDMEGLHNHTGLVVSLCLSGGYTSTEYHPPIEFDDMIEGEPYGDVQESAGPTSSPGFVHSISPKIMHRITGFKPKTYTLVVMSKRAENERTTVFVHMTGRVGKTTSYEDVRNEILDEFREIVAGNVG